MKFKRESREIEIPTKAHNSDAGYDIYSPESFVVEPSSFSHRVNLKVAFEIPEGYCGYIVERSSMGKNGVGVIGPVIDHGYTGFVHCTLVNNDPLQKYAVEKGNRICQLLLLKIGTEELEEVAFFEKTERGDKKHGSSGI